VNPNRQDDLSGLGHLCAAGVVFLTVVALNRRLRERGFWTGRPEPDLLALLDLVALATVADVVPLTGVNRAFVRQGLMVMRGRRRIGLAALIDAAGLAAAPECWHLGYLLGPRINAGGRIGDAALGSRLLLTRDPPTAARLAAELDRLNRERQVIEQAAVVEAEAMAARDLDRDGGRPVVVAAGPDWHPGVVGLIASRLKERFGRPAFAFALNSNGTATGSGRSIPGADLGRAVLRRRRGRARPERGAATPWPAGATVPADGLERFSPSWPIASAMPWPRRGSPTCSRSTGPDRRGRPAGAASGRGARGSLRCRLPRSRVRLSPSPRGRRLRRWGAAATSG
jgi:single-stranded-DNA-specific exonuclease